MAQNIYDDDGFFAAYSALPRSVEGLSGAAEWPALRALVPEVRSARVVDLGCGFGWFCRWAAEAGAARVVGIDLSTKMLARARAETASAVIRYECQDLDEVDLPHASFDLAFSSLTMHYLVQLEGFLHRVRASLADEGVFVFSVEHPIFTAPSTPGFARDARGHATWPLDGYLTEGPRTTDWLAPGVVKQHRTIATYLDLLRRTNFEVDALDEWGPTAAQIAAVPEWVVERERPPFLLVRARTSH